MEVTHEGDSKPKPLVAQHVFQVPEWENRVIGKKEEKTTSFFHSWSISAVQTSIGARLDAILPAHRKYLGRSRKTFLLIFSGLLLAIVALAVGLGIGLNGKSNAQDLPLPANAATFTGELTYFDPALGACGITSTAEENVVALSHIVFDAAQTGSNPNANPLCGLKIRAARWDERVGARRSVDLTVVDRCTGCQPTDLDTTTSVFDKLAPRERGRVDITWAWLSPTPPTS